MIKECTKCDRQLELDRFRKHRRGKGGVYSYCKECESKYKRDWNRTKKGFLVKTYSNMRKRVTGGDPAKSHLYKGLTLLPKSNFCSWSLLDSNFHSLFKQWEASEYKLKMTPSIDRIDSDFGYELSNMRWVTYSENSGNKKGPQPAGRERGCRKRTEEKLSR